MSRVAKSCAPRVQTNLPRVCQDKAAPLPLQHPQTVQKMNATEDEDLKLQRASASLLSDLEKFLPNLLRKGGDNGRPGEVHQRVREFDMYRIFALVS